MEISQVYSPKVKEWIIQSDDKFRGNYKVVVNYGFGLTAPDPNDLKYSYITIMPSYKLIHEDNGQIFLFSVEICTRILNNQVKPTPEFLFSVTLNTVRIANVILKDKTKNTVVQNKEIPMPDYYDIYPELLESIILAYP